MKKLLFLIILMLAGVWGGSPYYRLYSLKQAYETQNHDLLANSINYPALQQNISKQLNVRLKQTISDTPLLATLGGDTIEQVGNELITSSVNGAINPNNVRSLLSTQHQVNDATKQLAAIWATVSDKVAFGMLVKDMLLTGGDMKVVINKQIASMQHKIAETQQANPQNNEPELSYCALDCFQVKTTVQGFPLTIKLQRHDFIDWQVVDVVLP